MIPICIAHNSVGASVRRSSGIFSTEIASANKSEHCFCNDFAVEPRKDNG